ncbi:carbamoyltransferase HypF [Rhodococcus phenolicus]|uniref:carbamoyltransferase HypF n=1 Tax=Rhodococcus phenolicus TaxID=263849 RepID=UPI0009ED48D6|nr:carbamoyltransferase HypF [Rhodococcus phenolicus]
MTGAVERRHLTVRGVVQGVGFRPFAAALAGELRLAGHCGNDDSGVFVEIEGAAGALDEFARRLRDDAPPLAEVLDVSSVPCLALGERDFRIVDSRRTPGLRTLIPPDVATCADCLRELNDPADRRYRHPFVNCTHCGPRYTVITDLPYDRPATTMATFPMCPRCAREYADPADRRYHAQPICCPDCGPRIRAEHGGDRIDGDDAVLAAIQDALAAGRIVAVKGLGGYHLMCDATDPRAVGRLRERKRRPDKPFALMAPDVGTITEQCVVSRPEAAALTRPARPIVLLGKRAGSAVADGVAPGLGEFGVMLAYTPLHHLLFAPVPGHSNPVPRLLVMTSGNVSGEPLCTDDADARARLGDIADLFLAHDREIAVPCEDSVVVAVHGGRSGTNRDGGGNGEAPIRRSRGYAPMPVLLDRVSPPVLAVGAELKNTFCLTRREYAFCSAHLGDMGTLEGRRAFETSVARATAVHRVDPELVVADAHPGYATRQWAECYARDKGIALHTVQHHHAHVASLLTEHGRIGEPVLGIAFDGTGYGCDRTVWGGELLLVGPDLLTAHRAGHLRSFLLPGGDVAVRTPARIAVALLRGAGIGEPTSRDVADLPCAQALPVAERELVASQLRTGIGCVVTTSAGRLFDGVASLLGVRHRVTYEGQAAVELEAFARGASEAAPVRMTLHDDELDWTGTLRCLVGGLRLGVPAADLALGFHRALAVATARLATRTAGAAGVTTIGLTGGVFQNRLLTAGVRTLLQDSGFEVLTHCRVPSNDGGLSLGQAAIGATIARRRAADSGVRRAADCGVRRADGSELWVTDRTPTGQAR